MKVSEDNWQRLLDLLDSYLELSEGERQAMLMRTEAGSAELGATLRQLIRDFEAGALLSAQDFLHGRRAQPPRILTGGRLVGRYRLAKVIGRGAMSAVWLADQRGFSAARPVALKFLFSATHRVYERERLGELHHPGIARLLDSGVSEDGQPYLVWEHVEGLPLLKAAAARSWDVPRRVAVFADVLAALSHAHAHLALHRSLKPSNILVDADGQPHLLDFGTSSYPPGRSDYASPEQILGEAQSAAADVYGAGVVLYELLAGQRPYRLGHEVGRARADAILTAHVPPLVTATSAGHAASCGTTLKHLRRQLDRDLDAIVQKALHKDPMQRYGSADGFAQDLRRWLRLERVSARADTAGYRVTQFLRRNPLLAAALGSVLLGLTVCLAVAVGSARRAHVEAVRASAISAFLAGLFNNPVQGRVPAATDLLDAGLARIQNEFADAPEAQIQALATLAAMYAQIDEPDGAARAETVRLALMRRRYGPGDLRVIDAELEHAAHLEQGAQRDAARRSLTAAQAALDARHDTDSPRRARLLLTQARVERWNAASESRELGTQAVALLSRDDPDGRLVGALVQLAETRLLLADLPGARESLVRAAGTAELRHPGDARWALAPLCGLAAVQAQLGEVDDAEAKYRQCVTLSRAEEGEQSAPTARRELALARFLQDTGRGEEARQLLGPGARATPDFWRQEPLVQAALEAGEPESARQRLDAYLPSVRERYPESLLAARAGLQNATLLVLEGRFAEAGTQAGAALADARRSLGEQARPGALDDLLLAAARLDLARGEPAAALDRLQDVHEPAGAAVATSSVRIESQLLHAQALLALNRVEAAAVEAAGVLETIRRAPSHQYLTRLEADVSLLLAQLQIGAERFIEAQLHAERALSLREAGQDAKSLGIAEAQLMLARSLTGQRQFPLAQRQLADAGALIAAHPSAGAQYGGALKAAADELGRALHPPKPKRR